MKKGCFIKIIIVLTIIIAAILYILQNHLDDVVINPGKKLISDLIVGGIDDELNYIRETPEKDSLRFLLKEYLKDKISKTKEINTGDLNWIIDSIKVIVTDTLITQNNLNRIKELINLKDYERSKKD
ncbi:MAG: hypothetical protein A2080_11150 [Ignavibacteria bacterium GWC2_36_12]|nr:MAG: hypothetical protein A2080_11150 [Ignavibacteria bacterium GWC2_36_12]